MLFVGNSELELALWGGSAGLDGVPGCCFDGALCVLQAVLIRATEGEIRWAL
jgi:hypothetical protein